MSFQKQCEKFGVEIIIDEVSSLSVSEDGKLHFVNTASGKTYSSKSVIIATGLTPVGLGVPGEDKLFGRGVSHCATCDGAFFKDKTVLSVGGGNIALQESLYLAKICSHIHLIHRRDTFRGEKILLDRITAMNDKITIHRDTVLQEIFGETKVESVRIKNLKTSEESVLNVDGVFLFTGNTPSADFLKSYLTTNILGYVTVDSSMATSVPGVFACGDVTDKQLRLVVTACSDGAVAAAAAEHYLSRVNDPK